MYSVRAAFCLVMARVCPAFLRSSILSASCFTSHSVLLRLFSQCFYLVANLCAAFAFLFEPSGPVISIMPVIPIFPLFVGPSLTCCTLRLRIFASAGPLVQNSYYLDPSGFESLSNYIICIYIITMGDTRKLVDAIWKHYFY